MAKAPAKKKTPAKKTTVKKAIATMPPQSIKVSANTKQGFNIERTLAQAERNGFAPIFIMMTVVAISFFVEEVFCDWVLVPGASTPPPSAPPPGMPVTVSNTSV